MQKHKSGYTKAVDMWSLGGVAATILSGTPLFVDSKDDNFKPNPDRAIATLAAECDLAHLDQSKDWQHVGERAKDFVRRLLVLNEMKRMTVKEALGHPWFTNEFHKNEFQAVYLRAIRHWKPRPTKADIIEILDVDHAKEGPCSKRQRLSPLSRPSKKQALLPIEPPYIPYHRHISERISPRREPRSLAAHGDVPPAPWKAPIGWISSLHDAALLQGNPTRTDLASVRLRWPAASNHLALERKLGSRFTSLQAPYSTTALSPNTEMSNCPWRPAGLDTDEEDEVSLVPTSSPGRKLLAQLGYMSMSDIVYHTSTDDEEGGGLAHVENPPREGKLVRPSIFAEGTVVSPAIASMIRESKPVRGISISNFEM